MPTYLPVSVASAKELVHMPMPESRIKEALQRAYVNAVVARAGVGYSEPKPDVGTDIVIHDIRVLPDGKQLPSGILFHCQLKATTTCQISGDLVLYDMEVDDYNKIVSWDGGLFLLIVLALPENSKDWLNLDEEQLLLKRCCYWTRVTGEPSTNTSSRRIKIPRTQTFTPETVQHLLDGVRNGIWSDGTLLK